MNEVGAYDDIDMNGLDRAWYESYVPAEAQRRLVDAFPDLRLIWNAELRLFQTVYRQPNWTQPYYGGCCVMVGWAIIPGNYEPPLSMDSVIGQLRAREHLAHVVANEKGYATFAEYVEAETDKAIAKRKKKESDDLDWLLGINSETGTVHKIHNGSTVIGPGNRPMRRDKLPRLEDAIKQLGGPALRVGGKA